MTGRRPSLTTRGWALAGTAVVLYVTGRLLGTVELAMLAAAAGVVLAAAAVSTALTRPDLQARRTIHPERLHVGTPARAELEVTNRGRRRTPLLSVTDHVSGRREARFGVAPLAARGSARGAYQVPTTRRGVFAVGPLSVAVTDPLGLVRRPVKTGPREQVTVFPRVERIVPLPPAAGRDLVGGTAHSFVRSRSGDEFHGLREYVVGDDLRRVHWRSTARTGELMIRELDVPWQTRATVLLDVRAARHAGPSVEQAVEAAASIVTALHGRQAIVRLVTTDGHEVGFGAGHEHYEALMERLAVVGVSLDDRFGDVMGRMARQAASGALVVVGGDVPTGEAQLVTALGQRFEFTALVKVRKRTATPPVGSPSTVVVEVEPGTSFAAAWNQAVLGAGAPRGTRRPVR